MVEVLTVKVSNKVSHNQPILEYGERVWVYLDMQSNW